MAIGTEADTSNVQVGAILCDTRVCQETDLATGLDIIDLGGSVAASSDIATITTEADTAHDTVVRQVVDKLDVESSRNLWVEVGIPVVTLVLELCRQLIAVEINKFVSNILVTRASSIGRWWCTSCLVSG